MVTEWVLIEPRPRWRHKNGLTLTLHPRRDRRSRQGTLSGCAMTMLRDSWPWEYPIRVAWEYNDEADEISLRPKKRGRAVSANGRVMLNLVDEWLPDGTWILPLRQEGERLILSPRQGVRK